MMPMGRGQPARLREGRLALQQLLSASPRAKPLQSAPLVSSQPRSLTPPTASPARPASESHGPPVLSQSAPNLLQNLTVSTGSLTGKATCPGCGAHFEVSLGDSEPSSPLLDPIHLNFDFQTPVVDSRVKKGAKAAQVRDLPVSSTPAAGQAGSLDEVPDGRASTSLQEKFKQLLSPLQVALKSSPAHGPSMKAAPALAAGLDEVSAALKLEQERAGASRGLD